MARVPEKDNKTKEKLIKAGVRLFSKHGYAATTTRMIALEANVTLSSISFYFTNKHNLYGACLEYMRDKIKIYYEKSHNQIEETFSKGGMNQNLAFLYIKQLIELQIQVAFKPQYQTTLALVYQEGTNSESEYPLSSVIFEKQEAVMARLLRFISPISEMQALITSRFINGSIIAFAEHKSLIKPYIQSSAPDENFPEWIKDEIVKNCLAIVDRCVAKG